MVTILILIDGFLQFELMQNETGKVFEVTILILIDGFLQSVVDTILQHFYISHNPYFNRWFSAIGGNYYEKKSKGNVTILILIDGFLQYMCVLTSTEALLMSQSLF